MVRAAGIFGMAVAFLAISPKLRLTVYDGLESGIKGIEAYSPYSYIAAGVGLLIVAGITLYKGSQAR